MLSIRQKTALDFKTDKPAGLPLLDEEAGCYEFIETPLTPQVKGLSAAQKQLLASWDALRNVSRLSAEVVTHVRVVLGATVAGSVAETVLPPLLWERPETTPRVQPTAAHPRAYQGTKYKPPKDKAPASVDLRPYLCNADGLSRLLASLPSENEASEWAVARREMTFPLPFRLWLWPSLSADAEDEERFLALYWELALERQWQLLAAIALLVKRQPTANTRQWCQIIALQPEEWRLTFAALLVASKAYRLDVTELPPSALPLFWDVQNGLCSVYRLFWLFRALVNGLDCDYLAAGFRLADQLDFIHFGARVISCR